MADQILKKLKMQVESLEIIPSMGGVFEVSLNGDLIFSKKESGRFPETSEIMGALS